MPFSSPNPSTASQSPVHPAPAAPLTGRRIVLGVGGGIAVYKSVELLRGLTKAGAQVQVAMTQSAQHFVTPLTFQTLSGQPVFTDMFDNQQDADIGHIRVADGASLIVIAPATANLMARLAAGNANDPVTAAVLAATCPVLLAPAMNVNMWNAPATRATVSTLAERGMYFVGPEQGFLACKWIGQGRLSEPADIVEAAAQLLTPQDLQGKVVVVSAGGTEEAIDPVRFLGNRSTGKMGYALAKAAVRRGARVILVTGPASLPIPVGVEQVAVRSAAQMCEAVLAARSRADLIVMAAAVADYRPTSVAEGKLKKDQMGGAPSLELERTVDILARLGQERSGPRPILVGFAAETEADPLRLVAAARTKLASKKCDLIVANDVSQSDRGFASDQNAVHLVWQKGTRELPLASKDEVAHSIFDLVGEELLAPGRATP